MARRPLCLIVNPSAGRGRAARLLPGVEAALRARGMRFRVERTRSLVHEPELACDALAGGRELAIDVAEAGGQTYLGIASAGFDSDVQDVANATRVPLGEAIYVYSALRAMVG